MLVALIKEAVEFDLKEPASIKNSPTKLPVPGKPMFDIVKNKKTLMSLFDVKLRFLKTYISMYIYKVYSRYRISL